MIYTYIYTHMLCVCVCLSVCVFVSCAIYFVFAWCMQYTALRTGDNVCQHAKGVDQYFCLAHRLPAISFSTIQCGTVSLYTSGDYKKNCFDFRLAGKIWTALVYLCDGLQPAPRG